LEALLNLLANIATPRALPNNGLQQTPPSLSLGWRS
jgi:hypothetical protein